VFAEKNIGRKFQDIRYREVKKRDINPQNAFLNIVKYNSSGG
jgi:histone acetyltransferase (RNA polymerase elongator complex component)